MSEISHLATDKDIVDMWSVIIKIIYTLIAGAIGGACTFWLSRKKYLLAKQKLEHEIESSRAKIEADKKSIRQQMITNNIAPMRQEWINDLRKSSASLFSDLNIIATYQHSDNKEFKDTIRDEYYKRVFNVGKGLSYVDLLLPFKKDGNDELEAEKVRELLIDINRCISIDRDTSSAEEVKSKIKECRGNLKMLLKKEWEVTKHLKEIE
ncbi:hypothetical protein [Providencia sp. PROV063]|uniref:hypothetical protein n=1 Tax=Providencia sp. PROV063 TaxID=2949789 RepID=UPI00234B789C|nr:hypothetical protein [Providencia sp. PROV063]